MEDSGKEQGRVEEEKDFGLRRMEERVRAWEERMEEKREEE